MERNRLRSNSQSINNRNKSYYQTISFDRLVLKTAFCCMASDGNIDKKEVALIKRMCRKSPLFKDFDFKEEINSLVKRLNDNRKDFMNYYFGLLKDADLNVEDELILIDFAVKTIKSDELISYNDIELVKTKNSANSN